MRLLACLLTERFEEAVTYSTLAIQSNPAFGILHAYLVVGHIYLDRLDAAGMAAQRLLEVSPGFTVSDFERMDLWRPATTQSFAAALRKAGLPQ